MQPKLATTAAAIVLMALSLPLHAGPLDALGSSEVKALAYVSLPFGGVSRNQQSPIIGFTVNHTLHDPREGFSANLFQPASAGSVRSLVDIRFNTQRQNWQSFRIGGVDALTYTTRLKADGTTETVGELKEIPTWLIVGGVVVGAAAIHDATKKDKKDEPPTNSTPIGGGAL
jgi:hypothetical protein